MKTILFTGLWVGSFGLSAMADIQKVIDVKSIQEVIEKEHAKWWAKENWLTQEAPENITRVLGLARLPEGSLDFKPGEIDFDKAQSLDWRNVGGVNWLGPVMNQGNCGSCVAFATVATLEAQDSITNGIPWLHPTFSPQDLFSCGGGSCDSGWYPETAAEFLQRNGIPDEACFPYTAGSTGEDVACNQKCSNASSRSVKISSHRSPTWGGGSIETVKSALKSGPLVTTLTVYADFFSYAGGIYKHVTGGVMGGHAVSLVGYDDVKQAWLIRNSWGPEWGEGGFGWVSWDDTSGVGAETWGFELAKSQASVSVISPSDREYISGVYHLHAEFNGGVGREIRFQLENSQAHERTSLSCIIGADGQCTVEWDTTRIREGRYEIYAEIENSPSFKSQVREFYIINSEPKQELSFSVAPGFDLSRPLRGRPEFDVHAVFSPVPLQHLEFRVVDQKGKQVAIKSNDSVLEHMKMGWRTNTVPNGNYKIYFHGETSYLGEVFPVDSNSFSISVKN